VTDIGFASIAFARPVAEMILPAAEMHFGALSRPESRRAFREIVFGL
jgi:hypothetical protein